MEFEVTLSTASSNEITVDYATSDGTAAAGSDYTDTSGTLTFPANSVASQTIRVPVTDDAEDESEEETFTLTLSEAMHATLAGGDNTLAVTGTITDNDDPAGDGQLRPQHLYVGRRGRDRCDGDGHPERGPGASWSSSR